MAKLKSLQFINKKQVLVHTLLGRHHIHFSYISPTWLLGPCQSVWPTGIQYMFLFVFFVFFCTSSSAYFCHNVKLLIKKKERLEVFQLFCFLPPFFVPVPVGRITTNYNQQPLSSPSKRQKEKNQNTGLEVSSEALRSTARVRLRSPKEGRDVTMSTEESPGSDLLRPIHEEKGKKKKLRMVWSGSSNRLCSHVFVRLVLAKCHYLLRQRGSTFLSCSCFVCLRAALSLLPVLEAADVVLINTPRACVVQTLGDRASMFSYPPLPQPVI